MIRPTENASIDPPLQSAEHPILLGIDPGLQRTGYAVLACDPRRRAWRLIDAGLIRLNPREPLETRLVELERGLSEIIRMREPTVLACEELYAHYKHPRTAILMGHARGVILALAARRGLAITHIGATHVKKLLTGSGRAGKRQVQRAVSATLGLPALLEPDDVADAAAIALGGLRMHETAARRQANVEGAPA